MKSVYVFKSADGLIKVGVSSNPERRRKVLAGKTKLALETVYKTQPSEKCFRGGARRPLALGLSVRLEPRMVQDGLANRCESR